MATTQAPSKSPLLRPEVELRTNTLGNLWCFPERELTTSLDLLELYTNGNAVVKNGLGQSEFAQYCLSKDVDNVDGPCLRVFFVEEIYLPQPAQAKLSNDIPCMPLAIPAEEYKDKTALLMQEHFGVPLVFFLEQCHFATHISPGSCTLLRTDAAGNKVSLDGYYQHYTVSQPTNNCYTWFSQSLEPLKRPSSYVICNAPADSKGLLIKCAKGEDWRRLTIPFAIDAFLMNDSIMQKYNAISMHRTTLLDLDRTSTFFSDFSAGDSNLETLYIAARNLSFYTSELHAANATLNFLSSALMQLVAINYPFAVSDLESLQSSFALVKSKVAWTLEEIASIESNAKLRITIESNLVAGALAAERYNTESHARDTAHSIVMTKADLGHRTAEDQSASTLAPSEKDVKVKRSKRSWRRWLPKSVRRAFFPIN